MERNAKGRADVGGRCRVLKDDGPRNTRRFAVAAPGCKASQSSSHVSQCDRRRKRITCRPEWHPVAMDVPEGDGDCRDQPSIEDTSRPRKGEEIGRRRAELV